MREQEGKKTNKVTGIKKVRNILLKTLAGIMAVLLLFMVGVYTVNAISSKSEQKKIISYGQHVSVDGKNMNVLIQGQGEETIVLLPGFGTAAPALDFKLLIDELSPYYKVVAIEPFGYGLSDQTDKERTTENIGNEIHEALQTLNINRYILMGHSIAGIYGIEYINKFSNEVSAFVGIDSSVPTQPGTDAQLPMKTFQFLKESGLYRLILKVSGDPYAGLAFDQKTKEQMLLLSLRNSNNPTTLNEMKHLSSNFKAAEHVTFPNTLPVILFVQGNNTDVEGWTSLHEGQIKDSVQGKLIQYDGSHYLHHTKSKEIAEDMRAFLNEVR
jgi:2-hydroxy-6-oxonona-2,4-dienedioate hydrolase